MKLLDVAIILLIIVGAILFFQVAVKLLIAVMAILIVLTALRIVDASGTNKTDRDGNNKRR